MGTEGHHCRRLAHLLDLGVVELLDVSDVAHVSLRDEVDGHTCTHA